MMSTDDFDKEKAIDIEVGLRAENASLQSRLTELEAENKKLKDDNDKLYAKGIHNIELVGKKMSASYDKIHAGLRERNAELEELVEKMKALILKEVEDDCNCGGEELQGESYYGDGVCYLHEALELTLRVKSKQTPEVVSE